MQGQYKLNTEHAVGIFKTMIKKQSQQQRATFKRNRPFLELRKRVKIQSKDPAPDDEVICEIPKPKGQFLKTFNNLKKDSFALMMGTSYDTHRKPTKNNKLYENALHGFLAFRLYYSREFDDLPISLTAKLYSEAWKACDHKDVWDYFAFQYSKYQRHVPFLDWLLNCPKVPKKEESSSLMFARYEF